MNKYLYFLTLFSFSAFSMPSVGDYVFFTSKDGITKETEIISFNEQGQFFLIQNTVKHKGKVVHKETKKEPKIEMMTDDKIMFILTRCAANPGDAYQDLKLPAGKFNSCKMTNSETKEVFNVGHVPFGLVAMELGRNPENLIRFNLSKFRHGK